MIAVLLAGFLAMPMARAHAQAGLPVVRAVLFYSPACGHCHLVITETLPPLMEKYGSRLELIGVDVSQPNGQALFGAALQKFGLEQAGVPFLAIGDMYLIGSLDIPEKLPGLIEMYLAQGGVDWPDIPGLSEAIAASSQAEAGTATDPAPGTDSPASLSPMEAPDVFPAGGEYPVWRQRFSRDPLGNALAVVTLAFMLGSAAWTAAVFRRGPGDSNKEGRAWIVPALCLLGFGAAGYLAYVETAQVSAVCGPVGDCNTVQQSEYARLFGFQPIGVLGLLGYAAIFAAWLAARLAKGRAADLASISLFGLSAIGTMFSIYLTFLEPFVIGASCAWCLTSAVLMTILMMLSAGPARAAFSRPPFLVSSRRRRARI